MQITTNFNFSTDENITSNSVAEQIDISSEDFVIDSLSTLNTTLDKIYNNITKDLAFISKNPIVKNLKIFGPGASFVISATYNWQKEGPMQAIFTATLSTGATVALGATIVAFAPESLLVATIAGVVSGLAGCYVEKLVNNKYNEKENQAIQVSKNDKNDGLKLQTTGNIDDAKSIIQTISRNNDKNEQISEVEIKNGDEILTYEIKKGDTIWDICQKYGLTYDELIELNPWLAERFSDDREFALIRPGEKLRIPVKDSLGVLGSRPTFDVPFDDAQSAGEVGKDPILVDLDGDGIICTTDVESGVYFDHGMDGFAEASAWVGNGDGILVFDKNGDGIINDGGEVFGDSYVKNDGSLATSGFDALADLDSNGDGIISNLDEEFSNIKILKGDGSIVSLEEAGIVSINLGSTAVGEVDENGNTLVSSGTFVREDGSVGNLGDFNLVVDTMMSNEVEKIEVSEEVSVLPDIRGFGTIHSLHQAIMRDESGELKELVEDFINAEGSIRRDIVKDILYKWTGANNVSISSGGPHYDGQKLHVLEQFMGREFKGINNNGLPNAWAEVLLDNSFDMIMDYVYYSLAIQTDEELKNIYDLFELEYSFDDDSVGYNFDRVIEYIDNEIEANEISGKARIVEIGKIIKIFGMKGEGYERYYAHFDAMGKEYGKLLDAIGKIAIYGGNEASNIEGTPGGDAVFAGDGDDRMWLLAA